MFEKNHWKNLSFHYRLQCLRGVCVWEASVCGRGSGERYVRGKEGGEGGGGGATEDVTPSVITKRSLLEGSLSSHTIR